MMEKMKVMIIITNLNKKKWIKNREDIAMRVYKEVLVEALDLEWKVKCWESTVIGKLSALKKWRHQVRIRVSRTTQEKCKGDYRKILKARKDHLTLMMVLCLGVVTPHLGVLIKLNLLLVVLLWKSLKLHKIKETRDPDKETMMRILGQITYKALSHPCLECHRQRLQVQFKELWQDLLLVLIWLYLILRGDLNQKRRKILTLERELNLRLSPMVLLTVIKKVTRRLKLIQTQSIASTTIKA